MVESKKSKIGFGLFAKKGFKKGDIVTEIKGELHPYDESDNSNYIEYGHDEVLYPNLPWRHINHSCEPNCEFLLELNDEDKNDRALYLEALKDIAPGEELVADYAWEPEFTIPCKCETDSCRGWIVHHKKLHLVGKDLKKLREPSLN